MTSNAAPARSDHYLALIEVRDMLADALDLASCREVEDELEDLGMHPDDRETCHWCDSWTDDGHAH